MFCYSLHILGQNDSGTVFIIVRCILYSVDISAVNFGIVIVPRMYVCTFVRTPSSVRWMLHSTPPTPSNSSHPNPYVAFLGCLVVVDSPFVEARST